MHICGSNQTTIGSDNGLSPDWCQGIVWTNAGILFIGTLGTKLSWNPNQISYIFIQEQAFENVVWEMASILPQPQYVE